MADVEKNKNIPKDAVSFGKDEAKANKMSRLNLFLNKYFKLVIMAIVVVILILSFFYIIKPKYSETVDIIKGNIANQESIYIEQLGKLNTYKKLVDIYENIPPSNVEKVENILPPDYIKEQLFIELGYIIPQNGYSLSSLEFHKDTESSAEEQRRRVNTDDPNKALLSKLPRQIGYIEGTLSAGMVDYAGLKNLIDILENNLKLIDIYSLDYSPEAETVTVNFFTYYLKQQP